MSDRRESARFMRRLLDEIERPGQLGIWPTLAIVAAAIAVLVWLASLK